MKKITKIIIIIASVILLLAASFYVYFFVGPMKASKNISWGVDFSQMHAEVLGLNWKETYTAILDDLKVKNIKLHTQWDWVEGIKDDYFFDDIDWQIKEAEKRNVKIIYVLGIKTGRWPECHIPKWAENMPEVQQQEQVLEYVKKVINRYKNSKAIINWQLENEPFFKFGKCPDWYYEDKDFLEKEIALVKLLDPSRKIIISDSGEQSTWFGAAKAGDIVGITMYRRVWAHITDGIGFRVYSFLSPITYKRKAEIIKKMFGKDVICIELQAEPWASKPYIGIPLKEQEESMNLEIFRENVEFAKLTGLHTFYFWGVEWWYWLKVENSRPEIWNEARQIF